MLIMQECQCDIQKAGIKVKVFPDGIVPNATALKKIV